MTKSKAQIFLERVELIEQIIPNKLIERQQWQDLALSITAQMDGERVQSSGTKSKMADAVERCYDMEAEVLGAVDKLIAEKRNVVAVLERLDNPTYYKILHMKYIQHIELEDIADEIGIEYSNLTTTHGRALKQVEVLMEFKDGGEENEA